MNDFYDLKVIHNREVIREVDRGSTLELRWTILVGFAFAGLMCAYSWQQHRMMDYGYRMESLRKESAQLDEQQKKLALEQASLENPARIFKLAGERLGMASPSPDQLIYMSHEDPDQADRPVSLAWDLSHESQELLTTAAQDRQQP